jgi:hypothetical protein
VKIRGKQRQTRDLELFAFQVQAGAASNYNAFPEFGGGSYAHFSAA